MYTAFRFCAPYVGAPIGISTTGSPGGRLASTRYTSGSVSAVTTFSSRTGATPYSERMAIVAIVVTRADLRGMRRRTASRPLAESNDSPAIERIAKRAGAPRHLRGGTIADRNRYGSGTGSADV